MLLGYADALESAYGAEVYMQCQRRWYNHNQAYWQQILCRTNQGAQTYSDKSSGPLGGRNTARQIVQK
ncbi:hypothetical protein TNCV_3433091 [Trichonephila clavipes]|nr:hypothetical protein TNCV_3433091 [Trichonephila clavipes]